MGSGQRSLRDQVKGHGPWAARSVTLTGQQGNHMTVFFFFFFFFGGGGGPPVRMWCFDLYFLGVIGPERGGGYSGTDGYPRIKYDFVKYMIFIVKCMESFKERKIRLSWQKI